MNSYFPTILLLLLAGLLPHVAEAQRLPGTRREYISINTDVYEISVQKNGATTINALSGVPLLRGGAPYVRYGGETRFRRLNTDARNTVRFQVNDPLGQGQGLSFYTRHCEWHLSSYPAKPYFSVRLVYRNPGRNPVTIAALAPWLVSTDTGGAIPVGARADQALLLGDGSEPGTYDGLRIRSRKAVGREAIALHNPVSGRVLVAGFLTHDRAENHLLIERDPDASDTEFSRFQAVCVFDPPITVGPGESLEAEAVYIAVGETDMLTGMERFGAAVAATQGLKPRRPSLTSGFDIVPGTHADPPDASQVFAAIAFQKERLYDWGWRHLTLGRGWETAVGDWRPVPDRFPEGLRPVVEVAREADMALAIRIRPFLVAANAALATTHAHWLLEYSGSIPGESLFALNVELEEVRAWLTGLAAQLTRNDGFQAVIVEEADALLRCLPPPDSTRTPIQRYRLGLQAFRAGLGAKSLLIVTPWHPAAIPYADGTGPGGLASPLWHGASGPHRGALDMAAKMQFQGWLASTGITPDGGTVFLGEGLDAGAQGLEPTPLLTRNQGMAWLVASAMSGSPLHLGNASSAVTDENLQMLRCFSPVLPIPARPVDLTPGREPQIKHLPLTTKSGEWHIVACFNWSRIAEDIVSLEADRLGLDPSVPYTFYEFFPGVYHGLMKGKTDIRLDPASSRLFGLRPYAARPMLLASDRHISQGALDHDEITWVADANTLSGKFRADPVPYLLRFLAPEPWQLREATVSVEPFETTRVGEIITLKFDATTRQIIRWTLCFE